MAGRIPALNKLVSKKIWPSVIEITGIHWMRTMLRRFADAGGAVLLSSHLLHEVQQVADRIVMIGHGRILTEGSIADLTADGTDLETTFLNLTTTTARGGIFV